MQLSTNNKNLLISDKNLNLLVNFSTNELGKEYTISNADGLDFNLKLVNLPGEYEFETFGAIALETKPEKRGIADTFKISLESCDLLCLTAETSKLSKEDWDMLGNIDAIVIDQTIYKEMADFISKVEHQAIIVYGVDDQAALEKEIGLTAEKCDKEIKINAADVHSSEDVARVFMLLA